MKRLVIFILSVVAFNTANASLNTTELPRSSCLFTAEDTKGKILGLVEYKKSSYKEYESSMQTQIATLEKQLKDKNVEVNIARSECLENTLMSLSSISDIASDTKIPAGKTKKITVGSSNPNDIKDSFSVNEVTAENRDLIRQYLIN